VWVGRWVNNYRECVIHTHSLFVCLDCQTFARRAVDDAGASSTIMIPGKSIANARLTSVGKRFTYFSDTFLPTVILSA
jgi:hypothetical protein